MRYFWYIFLFCLLTVFSIQSNAQAEMNTNFITDPAQATFVYTDVNNFVRALELINDGKDPITTLQAEYFDRASPGLLHFMRKKNLNAKSLSKAICKHSSQYASLKDLIEKIKAEEKTFRKAFSGLKELIPGAVFLPTGYYVGDWRGISEASEKGILISIERRRSTQGLATHITHEHVHVQQALAQGIDKYQEIYGAKKSLLSLSIREGTADFIAALVTGKTGIIKKERYIYGIKHERRLCKQFLKEMNGRETGDWMWVKPKDPEQPPHMGYFMGYRIVEMYYDNAADKKKAIQDILSITDYSNFLKRSGYGEQFE